MKRTTLLAITICMAISTFAERRTNKDRSENWLQREQTTTSGNLRATAPEIGDEETPTDAPTAPGPVGGGFSILLALAGGYSLVRKSRRN
ncbi:MAG: hypothetical protein LBS25_08985 [Candidatus Symbiothrix sp.]|jgi:hypothetical protein|nr:hypothetical protein [Candidatus Symbiothrix sp.]